MKILTLGLSLKNSVNVDILWLINQYKYNSNIKLLNSEA
jgi:hypothetical protein